MRDNSSNEVRQELALSPDFLLSYQCALLIHRTQRQAMFRAVCPTGAAVQDQQTGCEP